MRKIWLISVIIGCFFVMSASHNIWSDSTLVGPDNPDYIANIIKEALQVGEVQDPAIRILLLQKMADWRIEEIKLMITKNKLEYIKSLVRAYEIIVQNIENSINRIITEIDLSKTLEIVERATNKHTEILTGLLEKVPEKAKPAIKHAIEVSRTGRNTALDRLQKIQEEGIPRGKPEEREESEPPEKPERLRKLNLSQPPIKVGKPER